MGTGFEVDSVALAQAEDLVATIAKDVKSERATLGGVVEGFLGDGWTGAAASQYGEAWADWRDGADRLLDALERVSTSMGIARRELTSSDVRAAGSAQQGVAAVDAATAFRLGGGMS